MYYLKYILGVLLLLIVVFHCSSSFKITKNNDEIQQSLKLSSVFPYIGTNYDIRLEGEIRKTDLYKDLVRVIENSKPTDRLVFHLQGTGGYTQTMYQVVNALHLTKAEKIMIVEAPVYSAHAYLATAGDKLIMFPLSSLMYHSSSALSVNCEEYRGQKDRGKDVVEKCKQDVKNELSLGNKLIMSNPVMTLQEKYQVIQGYDVYITAQEYYKRFE